MKTIKNYIIRKLGGHVYSDFDLDIQQIILKRMSDKHIDKHLHDCLKNGFKFKPFTK